MDAAANNCEIIGIHLFSDVSFSKYHLLTSLKRVGGY